MTLLSRLGWIGIAKETTQGTFVPPTFYLPVTKSDFNVEYTQLKDVSYRANDTNLQGLYQGVGETSASLEMAAYPDVLGYFLRVIGPDTVTAGVSTTLSSSSLAGATSISTAATIPAGSTIRIDTAGNTEYAITGTPSGSGPYTIPIATPVTGLTLAHSSSVAVVSQTTHTFKQSASVAKPTYSFVDSTVNETWGYPGCMLSEVGLKIDPKGMATLDAKLTGWIPTIQTGLAAPTFTALQPLLGWQWAMTNAGSSSTRGLSYDLTLKRSTDAIHASNGSQQPREVFSGVLDADIKYKAIYESTTDYNLYLQALQTQPTTAVLTQPVTAGGSSLTLTTTTPGWSKGGYDKGGTYVTADFEISSIYNSTDAGAIQAVLKTWTTSAY
ncbi:MULTISPECIES: phage tail tube protein [unclassified Streptomyces]|uniref:phage tail tube protein n=1 Tax=unclassified Streptomyces TaxID=2593676 RepID=UPI0033185AB3